jgi:hypothetical protein
MSTNINYMNKMLQCLTPEFKKFIESPCYYYILPTEVWEMILEYLSPTDIYNLMFSNKVFFKIVLTHANSLSLKFSNTLNIPELRLLFRMNKNKYNIDNIVIERVNFISIMNILNFANSNVFNNIYYDNNIILEGLMNTKLYWACQIPHINYSLTNDDEKLSRVSLYQASIRYGLLKVYCYEIKITFQYLLFIRYASFTTFNYMYLFLQNPLYSSFLSVFNTHQYIIAINNFFSTYNNHATISNIIKTIEMIQNVGGKRDTTFKFIMFNTCRFYYDLLIHGVKEEDASTLSSYTRVPCTLEVLLTFKALVPIVGYYYAHDFLLVNRYNLEEYPYFVQVASKMNSHKYYTKVKYLTYSKSGMDLDKMIPNYKRKRQREE